MFSNHGILDISHASLFSTCNTISFLLKQVQRSKCCGYTNQNKSNSLSRINDDGKFVVNIWHKENSLGKEIIGTNN